MEKGPGMAEKNVFATDDSTPPERSGGGAAEGGQVIPEGSDYPMTTKAVGSSRVRLFLLLLVLVVAGGGYYFLMINEPLAPPTPPPKVVVTVPPPAFQPAVTTAVNPSPAVAPAVAPPSPPQVLPAPAVAQIPPVRPVAAKPAAPADSGGAWLVEAGAYQDPRVAQAMAEKIRGLGYESQIRTVQRRLAMTRLRLGIFSAGEVKEALASARKVAPDAFTLRSGDTFTVYAGTYTSSRNIRQVSARLANAGVRAEEEPVVVKRTVNLVQFGDFADQAAAAEAAARVRHVGIAAEVVTPR